MPALLAPVAVLLFAPLFFEKAELSAKPGGKVKIDYNPPVWSDKFESQIVSGLDWRLGSGSATTMDTEAGLVFDDFVVFPGEYNLGATCLGSDAWDLVFHHDGQFITHKTVEGKVHCKAESLPPKKLAKKLSIEMPKAKDGGYEFIATFGTHTFKAPFTTAKAQVAKGKCVKSLFAATWLELADSESMEQKLEKGACVARIESKDLEAPVRVVLHAGDKPTLELVPGKEGASPITVDGTKAKAAAKAPSLACAVTSGEQNATFAFTIGESQYSFPVGPEVFDKY